MARITYTCKKCGWTTSLSELWSDIVPQKCPMKRCKTSFRLNPELLEIKKDQQEEVVKEKKEKHGK